MASLIADIKFDWQGGGKEVEIDDASGEFNRYPVHGMLCEISHPVHRVIVSSIASGVQELSRSNKHWSDQMKELAELAKIPSQAEEEEQREKIASATGQAPNEVATIGRTMAAVQHLWHHVSGLERNGVEKPGKQESLSRIEAICSALSDELAEKATFSASSPHVADVDIRQPTHNSYVAQITVNKKGSELAIVRKATDNEYSMTVEKIPLSLDYIADDITEKIKEYEHVVQDLSVSSVAPKKQLRGVKKLKQDLWRLRENKALATFALEYHQAVEAGGIAVASKSKDSNPVVLLKKIRDEAAQIEAELGKLAREMTRRERACNYAGVTQARGQRSALYRELDAMRTYEKVLETAIGDRKQLLAAVQADRASWMQNISNAKFLARATESEHSKNATLLASAKKALDDANEELESVKKKLEAERRSNKELNNTVKHLRQEKLDLTLSYSAAYSNSMSSVEKSHTGGSPRRASEGSPHRRPGSRGAATAPAGSRPASPAVTVVDDARIVDRLYHDDLRRRAEVDTKRNAVNISKATTIAIDVDEVNMRLYYNAKSDEAKRHERLEGKYLGGRPFTAPLSKEQLEDNLVRMYKNPLKEKDQKRKNLFNQVVLSREKQQPKLTEDARQKTLDRLFNREKR